MGKDTSCIDSYFDNVEIGLRFIFDIVMYPLNLIFGVLSVPFWLIGKLVNHIEK